MNNPHFTMPKVRILVADASRARLFRVDSPAGELIEVSSDVNPEARLHDTELTTDKPGRHADSMTGGRSAMEDPTDPKEVESQKFARQLTEKLEKARNKGNWKSSILRRRPGSWGASQTFQSGTEGAGG